MSAEYEPKDRVPLPPRNAKVSTTACDYCIVGCGYKVYTWPEGQEGTPDARGNALGIDFPVPALSGRWVSPNQHSYCVIGGKKHHVVVIADGDSEVVNRAGNHSIRGGLLAQKLYTPDGPTKDRLKEPMLRVNGKLVPISWDDAFTIMAKVSRHVIDKHGAASWAMKTYSYQYFENTYAISKIAFESIKTPAYAPHDKPGPGNDTAGVDDAGIKTFSASYHDWMLADVIFISGTDPYETKTILFTEWMMKGYPNKIIMVNPRRTPGAAYAEKIGGVHLNLIPGTDTILHLALIRLILENGWEDREFLEKHVANKWEIDAGFGRGTRNTPWQWRTTWGKIQTDLESYKKWVLSYPQAELRTAAGMTGVDAAKIRRAAELIARPVDGKRPKTSFGFEKGNYWSNNYLNTISFASLGLICGAGNRPGQVLSRLGGHQRGSAGKAAPYPRVLSPQKYAGRRKLEIDLDRWVEAGKVRFAWVIGTTWFQAMAGSQELARTVRKVTTGHPRQISSAEPDAAAQALIDRVDEGGMAMVHQDIYPVAPINTEIADLVLPAATWGESDFTRCNGERRLRFYSKVADPPGQAKPDWWIISRFAQKMGFKDWDWQDANQVFEEGARFSRGGLLNYHPLVVYARKAGLKGHELLRRLGTHGIQCPVRYRDRAAESAEYLEYAGYLDLPGAPGVIVGTKRLHDHETDFGTPRGPTVHKKWLTTFNTQSGKALLQRSPWDLFADFYERITPRGDELWVTSGRINERWQSAFDDIRRPYIMERWPGNFVEIHPSDAGKRGIESGDRVRVWNDDVLIQTGGFVAVEGDDLSYTGLERNGHIRIGKGSFEGTAIVTDDIRPGVLFTDFLWTKEPANSVVHRVADPITNRYRFKLGKGRIKKIGESRYKSAFRGMSFAPRTVMGPPVGSKGEEA